MEAKLEELASFIGQLGLGAGLLAFGALASQYSWHKFVVEGQTWDWAFAPDYLRFLITAITILVHLCMFVSFACFFFLFLPFSFCLFVIATSAIKAVFACAQTYTAWHKTVHLHCDSLKISRCVVLKPVCKDMPAEPLALSVQAAAPNTQHLLS